MSSLSCEYRTISIPYIEGDLHGELTAAVVREIAAASPFQYRSEGGDLQLIVKIIDIDDTNIGFRYDCKHNHKHSKSIIPSETRLSIVVEITLINAATDIAVFSPVRLMASIDLDHDYNYSLRSRGIVHFSLGQLTDADDSFEAAHTPLYLAIAQKITDYINSL